MSEQNESFNSIQPSNRTIIEESLEVAWTKVLEQTENPYPNLKNPRLCPDEFVALLAAEDGVLDYQPSDTLDQQRETTVNAFYIHSKAGSRVGIKNSLDVLNLVSYVRRGTEPYSIDIEAKLLDQALSEQTLDRISTRVDTYKSERDSYSLVLGRLLNGRVGKSGQLSIGRQIKIRAAQ